jgi:hypothetical protein
VETVLASVAITPAGVIHADGPWWGGGGPAFIASRRDPPPIPPAMRDYAERVRRAVAAVYSDESDVRVVYEGSFRNVRIRESVPLDVPGDDLRLEIYEEYTLSANAELTAVDPARRYMEGGVTRLCWKARDWGPCAREQRWIPFVPKQASAWPQITSLIGAERGAEAAERARFEAAVLAAARQIAAGGAATSFAELQAMQGAALLPTNLSVPIAVSFEIHARTDRTGLPQGPRSIELELPIAEALFETAGASTTGRAVVAGVTFTVTVWLEPDAPLSREASGRHDLRYTLRYRLRDDRGNERKAQLPLGGRFLVDGASAVAVNMDPGAIQHGEPPWFQTFPGQGAYGEFDVYMGIQARSR